MVSFYSIHNASQSHDKFVFVYWFDLISLLWWKWVLGWSFVSCNQRFLSSEESSWTSARWFESFTKYFTPQLGIGQSLRKRFDMISVRVLVSKWNIKHTVCEFIPKFTKTLGADGTNGTDNRRHINYWDGYTSKCAYLLQLEFNLW